MPNATSKPKMHTRFLTAYSYNAIDSEAALVFLVVMAPKK